MAVKRTRLGALLVPVLVWSATFATFAFVGISLAITTNPIYSLLVLVGFLMSILVTGYYRTDRSRSGSSPRRDPLCQPRLETLSPVYVEERATFYPQGPAAMSARSEPCLCNGACVPPRRSFSSPKVHRASGRMANAPLVSFVKHCPPHGAVRVEPRCEEVKSFGYHKHDRCARVRTVGVLYEDDAAVDDGVEVIVEKGTAAGEKGEARSPVATVIDMSGTELRDTAPEPHLPENVTADAESTVKKTSPSHPNDSVVGIEAPEGNRKPKRRLLWNMFAPLQDKCVLKEVKSEASSSSGPSIGELALANRDSIANAPQYRSVVAAIHRNIDPSRDRELASRDKTERSLASKCSSTARRGSISFGVNSASRSSSSEAISFQKDGALNGTPRPSWTRRCPPLPRPRSPSRMQDSEQKCPEYQSLREEVSDGHREELDKARPVPSVQSGSREPIADEVGSPQYLSNSAVTSTGQRVSEAPVPTSASRAGETEAFQLAPRVEADLVKVTVIHNPQQQSDSDPSLRRGHSAQGQASPGTSKHVQASCETSNAAVQIAEDGKRGAKPKSKWKPRLIPRFLKGKPKRYKHLK